MSDAAEEKKAAPDGIARSPEEKGRKKNGETPGRKGDGPADNARQRTLSQCIEYLEDGESEYSHPADMAEHLENLSLKEQVCLFRHLPADEAAEALAELDAKERDLIASFQKVGGSLRAAIEEGEKARVSLAEQVDGELLKVYEKTRSACGGVALSEVHEGACSACRNTFDSSRMSKIRSQAPLATCPVCRRLLIVEGE